MGANLSVLKSDNIVETLVNFAKENEITHVVMRSPNHHSKSNLHTELSQSLPGVEILVIPPSLSLINFLVYIVLFLIKMLFLFYV